MVSYLFSCDSLRLQFITENYTVNNRAVNRWKGLEMTNEGTLPSSASVCQSLQETWNLTFTTPSNHSSFCLNKSKKNRDRHLIGVKTNVSVPSLHLSISTLMLHHATYRKNHTSCCRGTTAHIQGFSKQENFFCVTQENTINLSPPVTIYLHKKYISIKALFCEHFVCK